ncbi:hypothetical protein FH972_021254 [Carpinus fangiana]|uniref:Uncharacterized protein n=1 Tax=Carpinus fangiana TaxID=176857 RepID=A0A5N6KPD6_9ROSI|nr:hypothetical protein FH972_021254 [Carpinus fangiana]
MSIFRASDFLTDPTPWVTILVCESGTREVSAPHRATRNREPCSHVEECRSSQIRDVQHHFLLRVIPCKWASERTETRANTSRAELAQHASTSLDSERNA